MYKIVIMSNSYYKKIICILMIQILCYINFFITCYSHAIRLVKSDRQFVYNIAKPGLHYQINLIH